MDEQKFLILCNNVAEEVCQKLTQISNELKIDENTVWIVFKQCLEEKEKIISNEYNLNH